MSLLGTAPAVEVFVVVTATLDRELLAAGREERDALEAIEQIVQSDTVDLIDDSGQRVSLPPSARAVLRQAAHELLRGNRVSLIPVGTMLTTQQAAELLNVSRPYLIRLLERGELSYELVGTHRRVRLDDVLSYRQERTERRRQALRELSKEADELGIYTE
jgi:excisionase family DNA binding protein